jgi:spore cortex biosynthesis protein YabQ
VAGLKGGVYGMVQEQVIAFILTAGVGFLGAFLFDFYRVLQRLLSLKKAGIFLGDLVFCLFLTAFVFGLLLLVNYGEVRFYVLLGMALGGAAYFRFFGRIGYNTVLLIFRALQKALFFLFSFFVLLWKVLVFPFRFFYLGGRSIFVFLAGGGRKGGSFLKRTGRKILGGFSRFLKRNLKK